MPPRAAEPPNVLEPPKPLSGGDDAPSPQPNESDAIEATHIAASARRDFRPPMCEG
jgi:hypothetical protein